MILKKKDAYNILFEKDFKDFFQKLVMEKANFSDSCEKYFLEFDFKGLHIQTDFKINYNYYEDSNCRYDEPNESCYLFESLVIEDFIVFENETDKEICISFFKKDKLIYELEQIEKD